ncbi:MAG: hypothetical protein LBU27_04715 [Candidatus Peribacteria bacterium]|jgi:excinuclease UvrABC nuclease subunit|nr:hypothetical protein [Candidatus Peribacteria bacterium]
MKFLKSEQQALQQMLNNFFDSYLISTSFEGENMYNDLLGALQERYQLKNFPYHMECVDISHLSGGRISGGLSCMVGGILEKKGYRKYKIRGVKGQSDDYASLAEVITRRLCRDTSLTRPPTDNVQCKRLNDEVVFPDVFILD